MQYDYIHHLPFSSFVFPFIENIFFTCILIKVSSPLFLPVLPHLPSHPLPFCLSLENKQASKGYYMKDKVKWKPSDWSWTRQTEGKLPKRRHKNQRPTHSHTQKSHKTWSWELYTYRKDVGKSRLVLCMVPRSLWVHMSFDHSDLQGFVFLVFSLDPKHPKGDSWSLRAGLW